MQDCNGIENVTWKYKFISFVPATWRIILTRSTSTQTTNYPGTKLVGVVFKKINPPSRVYVLHKTLNLVISRCCFAEDGKEMYQNF